MFQHHISSRLGSEPEIETERKAIDSVIAFLDSHLPNFSRDFKIQTSSVPIDSEDLISQELCVYLQRRTYPNGIFMFQFQRRNLTSKHSSDFGVIAVENYNPTEPSKAFFVIEGKRLPTPGTGREKEYVQGRGGGIERFKRGFHGNGLSDSAIIGYVQDQNCNYWLKEINDWVRDLTLNNIASDIRWDSDDLLKVPPNSNIPQKYLSKNTRIVESVIDSINLHHYLLDLEPISKPHTFSNK